MEGFLLLDDMSQMVVMVFDKIYLLSDGRFLS